MSGSSRFGLVAAVAAGVVALDQLTKSLAVARLADETVPLFWTVRLNLTFNSGLSFGQGKGLTGLITVVGVVLVGALAWWSRRASSPAMAVALALLLGGACGNLVDRLFRGHHGAVIDFIDPQWWPVFNVADIAISSGAVLLLLTMLREPRARSGAGGVREVVPPALAGERIDRVVSMLTELPRAEVASVIEAGHVRIGGRTVERGSRKVREGEVVEVDVPERPEVVALAADPSVDVPVVHEDDDVLVVDKPAGLVVHPGAGHVTGTMVQGLMARYPELIGLPAAGAGEADRPGIVHRLDAGTSGLLVVARTPSAYHALVAQLAAPRGPTPLPRPRARHRGGQRGRGGRADRTLGPGSDPDGRGHGRS